MGSADLSPITIEKVAINAVDAEIFYQFEMQTFGYAPSFRCRSRRTRERVGSIRLAAA
jgi:hypothetical protein